MDFSSLPNSAADTLSWSWEHIEPFLDDLISRPVDATCIGSWLADWSQLRDLMQETYNRLYIATTLDTMDQEAAERYDRFLDDIYPKLQAKEQLLKDKLLDSDLVPAGFEQPLRNMRAEADLFRESNLPLLSEEKKLNSEYDRIIGGQTVEWRGEEVTLPQLQQVYQENDRSVREEAWRLASQRQLADRGTINELWVRYMDLRRKLATNADRPNYRDYRWQQLFRFDYTPEDCYRFHQAIEAVVVPAASRIYEKRRQQLGYSTLRPWDLAVDPLSRPPLRPYQSVAELEEKGEAIFRQVDPVLGENFATLRREGLLDLENRKGKAPGAYSIDLPAIRRPFVFLNAVGLHDDVQTILHEGGHAMHTFETANLPYSQQLQYGAEIAEVASMAMELLGAPYLEKSQGGFYSPQDTARGRIEHLEGIILFWPYMAVVDAFQHWVYENHHLGSDPAHCDAKWAELWQRFMPSVNYQGFEDVMMTGWQRKLHIHEEPFYYIEYGMAQLGAVQVWENALRDQAGAVAAYRKALSLGNTRPLPDLFAAAGARFSFDSQTIGEAVALVENQIAKLEAI